MIWMPTQLLSERGLITKKTWIDKPISKEREKETKTIDQNKYDDDKKSKSVEVCLFVKPYVFVCVRGIKSWHWVRLIF